MPAEILALAGIGHQPGDAFEVEVLGDVVVGPVPHGLDGGLELLAHRDDDHFDVRVVFLRDLQDLEAADARQPYVEQHQVDLFLFHHLQGGLARGGPQHAVLALQESGQRVAHTLVVIDDEDGLPAFGHSGREYNALP